MKRFLLLLTLALCLPVSAQIFKEEEDLMQAYGVTEEYLNMQRQMDSYLEQQEKNQQKEKTQRIIMLVLSLAVAVVPVWEIGKRIVQHPEERTPMGATLALLIAIAAGAVLFAFNYGWMYLRLKHGDAINFPLALLITIGIIVGCFILLNKKDGNNE